MFNVNVLKKNKDGSVEYASTGIPYGTEQGALLHESIKIMRNSLPGLVGCAYPKIDRDHVLWNKRKIRGIYDRMMKGSSK